MSMDINPISLQMVVPRTTEAGQVQHNMNQQVNVQQEFAMAQEQTDVKTKMETVQTRDNPEDGRIKDDPDRQRLRRVLEVGRQHLQVEELGARGDERQAALEELSLRVPLAPEQRLAVHVVVYAAEPGLALVRHRAVARLRPRGAGVPVRRV